MSNVILFSQNETAPFPGWHSLCGIFVGGKLFAQDLSKQRVLCRNFLLSDVTMATRGAARLPPFLCALIVACRVGILKSKISGSLVNLSERTGVWTFVVPGKLIYFVGTAGPSGCC